MNTIFYSLALIAFSIFSPASYSSYPSHTSDVDFIKKVRFPIDQLPEGKFTEQSLPRFLAAAYAQHKISSHDFKDVQCIKAKNLLTKSGFNTAQLFLVTTGCGQAGPGYIIKEATRPLEEAMNLEAVKNIPGLKTISAPHERPGFPTIALPIAFLTAGSDDNAVTVMPLAKGTELCDFINAHKKLQTESDQRAIKKAYYGLGREGANFRREFHLVHRDMKCANTFVDKKHATLIDNETMAPSSDEPDYNQYQDMRKVLFGNYLKNETREVRHMLDGVNLSAWFEASFKSYIQGWVDTYPPEKRRQALSEIREALSPPWEGLSVDYDQEKLDEVRAKYLIPILDKVGSTYH